MIRSLFAVAGLLVLLTTAQTSPTFIIDLQSIPRSTEAEMLSVAGGDVPSIPLEPPPVTGIPRPVVPLEFVSVTFDSTDLHTAQPFRYDLVLRNVGGSTLMFPRSLERHRFSTAMTGLTLVRLSIRLEDSRMGTQSTTLSHLYGANSVLDSLIPLAPQQTVSLRGEASLSIHGNVPTEWPRSVSVYAAAGMFFGPQPYQELRSATQQVMLFRP